MPDSTLTKPSLDHRTTQSAALTQLDWGTSAIYDAELRMPIPPRDLEVAQIKVAFADTDSFDTVLHEVSSLSGISPEQVDHQDLSALWEQTRLTRDEKAALQRLGKAAEAAGLYGKEEIDEALVAEGFGVPALGALAVVVVVALALWVV